MSESHEITQAVGARLDCHVGQRLSPTPGPWRVMPSFWNGGSSRAEGPGIFAVEDEATGTVVCDRRTPWPERAAEMEANARLIAAAPDLLAAVERLLRAHYSDGIKYGGDHPAAEARRAVEKAVLALPNVPMSRTQQHATKHD